MNSLLAGKWPWMAASLAALTMLAVHRGCSGTTAAFDAGLLRLESAGADSARRCLGNRHRVFHDTVRWNDGM